MSNNGYWQPGFTLPKSPAYYLVTCNLLNRKDDEFGPVLGVNEENALVYDIFHTAYHNRGDNNILGSGLVERHYLCSSLKRLFLGLGLSPQKKMDGLAKLLSENGRGVIVIDLSEAYKDPRDAAREAQRKLKH